MRGWILALSLALAACGQNSASHYEAAAPANAPAPPPPAVDAMADRAAPEAESATGGAKAQDGQAPAAGPQEPAPISYLAYSYAMGLEVPGGRLIGLMNAHAAACQAAGPRLCQLIGANRDGEPEASISGQLSLRGEPAWLSRFMAGVSSDAQTAGGKIKTQSTSTEDLTRAIVDTEATLRAKSTLRDRLQAILQTRPGRLSDLLDAERELARVQGEIDATQSELAAMRTRVSMSALTISYESTPRSVASDTFEPLGHALAGFIGNIVQGIAIIVTLIAVLIPWAIIAALVAWFVAWLRKKRGGRLLPRKNATPTQPPPAANA